MLYSSKEHLLNRYAKACPAGLYMRRSWSEPGYEAWVCMSPLQAHLLASAEYAQNRAWSNALTAFRSTH